MNIFTNGRWTVTKSCSHNGYTVQDIPRDGEVDVSVFAPYGAREQERQATALAVANLVAAAPEMFTAISDFLLDHRNGLGPDPERLAAAISGVREPRP